MGTEPPTDDRIDLPPDFADHLAAVSNLVTLPETMGEYCARCADQLATSNQTIEPEDLYMEDPTRHEVRANDHRTQPSLRASEDQTILSSASSTT